MDNYAISKERAQRFFLGFDQEKILHRWAFRHDDDHIFLRFLGREYQVCRHTGQVFRLPQMEEAEHGEVLSIFDLMCHQGKNTAVTGRLAPVNSLKGNAAVGVGTDFYSKFAARIDAEPERFCRACLACGGVAVEAGDIGFRFCVFEDLPVVLKFYRCDEDFPASLTLLWEENMLEFVYYESVFYIAGVLLSWLEREMERV